MYICFIRRHSINSHSYTDDTQLHIAVSPDDTGPIDSLLNCILDMKSWMAESFLQLNCLPKLNAFKPSQCVKNLGVLFDFELDFIPHRNTTKIFFYQVKNIARVRPFLSLASTEVLMHAFISSRLDYCDALLSGLPKKSISQFQLLQNSAACVLTETRKWAHIPPVSESMHWLPVCFRILRFFY